MCRFWSAGPTECHSGSVPNSQPFYGTLSRDLGLIDGGAHEQIMCPLMHIQWEGRPQLLLSCSCGSIVSFSVKHLSLVVVVDLGLFSLALWGISINMVVLVLV